MKKWKREEEVLLTELYLKDSLPLDQIARKLGRSVASLSGHLTKLNIKRKLHPNSKYPKKMTPTLSRIHAHLCADGCIYYYQERDTYGCWAKYRKKNTRIRYRIAYCNTNKGLIEEFKKDLHEAFGLKVNYMYKHEIKVSSKRIYDFFRKLGVGKSRQWKMPRSIIDGSKEIQKSWIRAFFDDEAYFNDGGRIRVKCVNRYGLLQLAKIVSNFVPCNVTPKRGFYKEGTVCLSVAARHAPKFFKEIGSIRYRGS